VTQEPEETQFWLNALIAMQENLHQLATSTAILPQSYAEMESKVMPRRSNAIIAALA